jgi:hypothetical protein
MNSRRLRRLVGRGVAVAAVCLGLTILGTGISLADQSTVPGYDPVPQMPAVVVVPSAPMLPGGGVMTASDWTWL